MAALPALKVPVDSYWPRTSVSGEASFSSRSFPQNCSASTAPGALMRS